MRHLTRFVVAGFAVLIVLLGAVFAGFGASKTLAATGSLSSLSLTLVSDGTAPFDSSTGAGFDTGATNGIVRTHDSFDLTWSYVVASAGDITFTQTLSNGLWSAESAGSCTQGAAAISANKKTITCTLASQLVGSGSYTLRALADGNALNGSSITGAVSAGVITSNNLSLTVSATPKVNISTLDLFSSVSKGPGSYSAVDGYTYDVPVALWSNATGVLNGFVGVKGLESVGSSVSFNAVPSQSTAVLYSCGSGPAGGTRPSLPNGSGGDGVTNVNSVRNSGSWTCAQSTVGGPVSVNITGMDSSLNSYPTKSANNADITANQKAYFSVGYVKLWIPKTSTTANAVTSLSTKITNFDPTSGSGLSNYGAGYATNQPDPGSCVAGTYQNCSVSSVNRIQQNVVTSLRTVTSTFGVLPGATVTWDGLGQVVSGTQYYVSTQSAVPAGNEQMTDVSMCVKWDPTQSRIDTTKSIVTASGGLPVSIEYGTATYSNLADYQGNNCGRPGIHTTDWYSSVAAAGGASHVTAVRVTFVGQLGPGSAFEAHIPQVAVSNQQPNQIIGFFGNVSSAEISAVASTFNPSTNSGSQGTRVTFIEAQVGVSIAWDAATTSAPATRTLTLTPQLLTGSRARDFSMVATLPSACFDYVPGSASLAPHSITPANVGPDNIPCTADDVSPAQLNFNFGDINSTPTPVTFRVNISQDITVPRNAVANVTVSSPSDPVSSPQHSGSATLAVSSVAGFSVSKTADTGRVREGVPFNYTITWQNGSTTLSGGIKVVDVLPFSADSRGSSGFSSLRVNSVTTSSAVVQYSSLDSATALSLVATSPDGENAAFGWSTTKPAHVTAIRFVVANQPVSSAGSATINLTASGIQAGGSLVNDLYAVASFAPEPLKAATSLPIQTLGSASLAATKTANVSEITAAGQSITYTVQVQNTGQEALSGITVSDFGFTGSGATPTVTCPSQVLAAGASMNCVSDPYTVTQNDLDQLTVLTNKAKAIGNPPAGAAVNSNDAAVSTPITSRDLLTASQTSSLASVSQSGVSITYTYTLTNSGNRSLSSLSISRQGSNGTGIASSVSCGASSLAPGTSTTCTSTYEVSQADIDLLSQITNPATAAAISSGGQVSSNPTNSAVTITTNPSLSVDKYASVASYSAAGQSFNFVFQVTNTGNVTLGNVSIEETHFTGTGTLGLITCAESSLAPGASTSCQASYVTTQADYDAGQIENSAKASATFRAASVVSTVSTAVISSSGQNHSITIETTSDVEEVSFAGDHITYSFVVTNAGNLTLNSVFPSVTGFTGTGSVGTVNCPSTSLAPGASTTCTASYVVTQADIDSLMSIVLDSTVSAQTSSGTGVSDTANSVDVEVTSSPHLDVAVTANRSSANHQGDQIIFHLTITNDGPFTMSHVLPEIEDFDGSGNLGVLTCPSPITLVPGQSAQCTISYDVTQTDIDTKDELTLVASGEGEYKSGIHYDTPLGRELNDAAVVFLTAQSQLSMVKVASLQHIDSAGTAVNYTFTVTNLGTRTLQGVEIIEQLFTGRGNAPTGNCLAMTLAPGAQQTCSLSYTTVASDLALTRISNTAIASGHNLLNAAITSLQSTAHVQIKGGYFPVDKKDGLVHTGMKMTSQLFALAIIFTTGIAFIIGTKRRRRS